MSPDVLRGSCAGGTLVCMWRGEGGKRGQRMACERQRERERVGKMGERARQGKSKGGRG